MTDHGVGTMASPPAVKKLETIGWGIFFIWIGVALLVHLSWGLTLLGIGVLTLATQIARKQTDRKVERFWVVMGTLFVLAGAWLMLGVEISLMPVLFILAGVALFLSALLRKPAKA